MANNNLCEKCNGRNVTFHRGSSMGFYCVDCGWGAVTSYFKPIYADSTQYTLSILPISVPTIEQIKVVSELLGENYINTKASLIKGECTITRQAHTLKDEAQLLKKNGVLFSISPAFPYDIDDEPIRIDPQKLCDEDLLWFALDKGKHIVAFTTQGTGKIPEFVCTDENVNDELYDCFTYRCKEGTNGVFDICKETFLMDEAFYVKRGIFFYNAQGKDYSRVCSPECALTIDMLEPFIQNILLGRVLDFDATQDAKVVLE